jgi:lysyl-tRNA synthetase class 2
MNPDTRELFRKKSRFWSACRGFLVAEGFLEVDMSALEPVPGGAEAEPFMTHHNALDTDFYLRISLELPLKKLIVGGYEKVFEIGRVFRNEGIDRDHLQDYVQLEFYWAYADYQDLMKFVEKMYKHMVRETCGTLTTSWRGEKINWGRRWERIDYNEAFKKANGFYPATATHKELLEKARKLGVNADATLGRGRLIDLVYKKTVRPHLIQPSFLINHPVIISPLSKRSDKNADIVERIQVLACASELGNGWSELNDPLDQRERFEEQVRLREAGDKEAQMMDEDFVEALEYGMPPTAGFGLSERVFSILMDRPIRETVFFPLMKEKTDE